MNTSTNPDRETGLFKTLYGDVRQGGFRKTLKSDWQALKQFYLDDERKARLAKMGRIRRAFVLFFWLLKSMLMRLSPIRRVMLVVGIILIVSGNSITWQGDGYVVSSDHQMLGGLLLLFVLMLELKDKLLARSELTAGREVQFALMPQESPAIPGWDIWLFTRPANDVGGDLLDFQQVGPQRYGIAVGDVSGKGLPAAMLMSKIQATLRALAPDCTSVTELGEKVNRVFYRDGLRSKFASLIYLELTPDTGKVRLFNAGHMPPIHIQNGEIRELPGGEMAIGLTDKTKYSEISLDMADGDYLLIYSDGLTEAQSPAGEFFGDQRLIDTIRQRRVAGARAFGEYLLAVVNNFIADAPVADDFTLAILRKVPPGS